MTPHLVAARQNLQLIVDQGRPVPDLRTMELDIHRGMTFLATRQPRPGGSQPTKLLPTMSRSPYRYLVPDQRDFFYLTATTPTASARH